MDRGPRALRPPPPPRSLRSRPTCSRAGVSYVHASNPPVALDLDRHRLVPSRGIGSRSKPIPLQLNELWSARDARSGPAKGVQDGWQRASWAPHLSRGRNNTIHIPGLYQITSCYPHSALQVVCASGLRFEIDTMGPTTRRASLVAVLLGTTLLTLRSEEHTSELHHLGISYAVF